jgi:hypothetical protein
VTPGSVGAAVPITPNPTITLRRNPDRARFERFIRHKQDEDVGLGEPFLNRLLKINTRFESVRIEDAPLPLQLPGDGRDKILLL